MAEHLTEEEQIEALKNWWKQNGVAVIAGLVIGLGGLFGWRYWADYKDTRAEQAGVIYEQVLNNLGREEYDKAGEFATQILTLYDDTAYGPLASLALAKVAAAGGDSNGAQARLQWVLDNADDAELQHVARLRLARLRLAQGDAAGAKDLVSRVEAGTFAAAYQELLGDIHVMLEEYAQAREAYQQSLTLLPPNSQDRRLVKLKLDDLAGRDGGASEGTS